MNRLVWVIPKTKAGITQQDINAAALAGTSEILQKDGVFVSYLFVEEHPDQVQGETIEERLAKIETVVESKYPGELQAAAEAIAQETKP